MIQAAADRLNWIAPSDEPGAPSVTRMIVIAGNEPFIQGATPCQSAIPSATNKGITVYTVFCGPKDEGVSTFWKDGATLGEGRRCAINHNRKPLDDAALLWEESKALLELTEALEIFRQTYPRQCEVVDLKYIIGLTEGDIALVVDVSPATVRRDWKFARSWLLQRLGDFDIQ